MKSKEVASLIEAAFADIPIPSGQITYLGDDEGAQEYFCGTHWSSHTTKSLRSHDAALHFFMPEAWRYYLPAYMMAVLNDPEEADILSEYIVWQFSQNPMDTNDFTEKLGLLTAPQKSAILAFISYENNLCEGCFEFDLKKVTEILGD